MIANAKFSSDVSEPNDQILNELDIQTRFISPERPFLQLYKIFSEILIFS